MMLDKPQALLWAFLASAAGAITALSFRPFARMSRGEIFLALFVGASFAFFVGPWVVQLALGDGPIDLRIAGGIFYLLASGSNVLVPIMVRKLSQFLGERHDHN